MTDWPKLGSRWRHYNGNVYVVVAFSNVETVDPVKYPPTIIHRNVKNGKLYSRPLADWARSMTEAEGEIAVTRDFMGLDD